jgi:hypothetical protein
MGGRHISKSTKITQKYPRTNTLYFGLLKRKVIPFSPYPCTTSPQTQGLISNGYSKSQLSFASKSGDRSKNNEKDEVLNGFSKPEVGNGANSENYGEKVDFLKSNFFLLLIKK